MIGPASENRVSAADSGLDHEAGATAESGLPARHPR